MIALLCAVASGAEYHEQYQVGAAMWPEGLQVMYEGEWRFPLGDSENILFEDAHVAVIAHAESTPAFFPRGGPALHVAPIAVWDATVRAYGTVWLGTFSAILPTDDPEFTGTKEDRQALIDAGVRRGGHTLRFDARTRLKGKVGPVLTMFEFEWRRHRARTWDGDFAYFWEPTEMLTIPSDAWVFDRRHYLFVEAIAADEPTDRKLWIGALSIWTSCAATDDEGVRSGPVVMWKPRDGFTPTWIVGSQLWLVSRFAPTVPPYTFAAVNWAR